MKKRLLALTLTAIFATTSTAFASVSIQSFTDYNTDLGYGKLSTHWAKSNIETLLSHNGMSGYAEGDFRANKEISAAELIAIILNVTNNSDDLTGETWAEKILTRAYELCICTDQQISLTEGNSPISREKMALVLVNSAEKLNNEDTTSLKLVSTNTIADLNTAHAFYQNSIIKAYSMGLVAGKGNGYAPKANVTRAEASAIVNRLMGYTDRVQVVYEAVQQQSAESVWDSVREGSTTTPPPIPYGDTSGDGILTMDEVMDPNKGGFFVIPQENTGWINDPEDQSGFFG